MGVCCYFSQISDSDIMSIIENPKRVELLLNDGEYFEEPKGNILQIILSKIFKKKADNWMPESFNAYYDIDKMWHPIHFVLTGSPFEGNFPLNFIAYGGIEVGKDNGYGALRVLYSNEVKELKNELDKISIENFKEKLNIADLNKNDIYPKNDRWDNEILNNVIEEYENLKYFINDSFSKNKGIYISIS